MIKNILPGYRLLRARTIIKEGDLYWSNANQAWRETTAIGGLTPNKDKNALVDIYIRKIPLNDIQHARFTTRAGNHLSFSYNPDNDLLVVDLVAKDETGGNEVLRQTLNETKLLQHCK